MFLHSLKVTVEAALWRYFKYCHYGDFVTTDFGSVTKKSAGRVGMDRTVCGDRRGWIRISVGTDGDGCEL